MIAEKSKYGLNVVEQEEDWGVVMM